MSIESPDLVQIRLEATDLSGNSLAGKQITAGTEFYVNAWVDDLGIRNGTGTFPASQEGVFSAYLDINYNPSLARPVTVSTTDNPLGFDITTGPLFKAGLKGINRWEAGIVDEVGAYQGGTAVLFSNEQLLFQIRFRALGGAGGQLVFSGNEAEEVVNETTLIKPDPGVSVPDSPNPLCLRPVLYRCRRCRRRRVHQPQQPLRRDQRRLCDTHPMRWRWSTS